MKKSLQFFAILFFGAAIFMIDSCSKKKGDPGPAGNANVTSNTFTASSWTYVSPSYYTNLSVSTLTSSNSDTAAVMVYFNKGGSTWTALPFTQYNSPADYYMGFSTKAGEVQVTWIYDSSLGTGSDPNTYYSTNVKFKVVVIPPTARKANTDIDLKSYDAVKRRFNLAD